MLITFFKTLVSIEQCNNEDVMALCDVCLDGLNSALPSTKNKYPLHTAWQHSTESELLKGKQILLFSLPFSRNVSCPKHHKVSFKVTVILTAMQCRGSLMTWRVCHLFVAISEVLSCLLACVITRKERGLCWTGRSSEYLSSLASSMWRLSSWSSPYR